MSVSCYFGLTESGKSYHVKNHVLPKWEKKVIFDIAHCFDGDLVVISPDDKKFYEIFKKFSVKSGYSIVIRPSRSSSDEVLFNKTVHLACALGRYAGKGNRLDPEKRVQFVCDESDFVCSPNYQSKELKHVVNKGRHDNVDSHFIARNPMRIHTDIRANSTKIVTFFLNNALEIPLFLSNFSRKIAEKVQRLPKFWRLEWTDNGEIKVFNEKNKIVENLSKNSDKFSKNSQNFREAA